MGLKSSKELVISAVNDLYEYQTGKKKPIKTSYKHLNENCLGGIFPQNIIVVGGMSSMGKTYFVQKIEEDMFNKELNPECDDFLLVRCNWEMPVQKLIVRKLSRELNKPISEIYSKPFNDDEKKKARQVLEGEMSDKIHYLEEPLTPEEFEKQVGKILEDNKDKKQILITIDHIALIRTEGDKKKAIDILIETINMFKKSYPNCSFIILTQLNRDIEGRRDIKDAAPRPSDVYMSSTLQHISDVMLVVHNPYKLGIEKIMVVQGCAEGRKPKYFYLKEWMTNPNNVVTNFSTKGGIFYFYLKLRESDDAENVKDVHVEQLFGKKQVVKPMSLSTKVEKIEKTNNEELLFERPEVEDNSDLEEVGNQLLAGDCPF